MRICVVMHGYFPADARVRKEVQALSEAGFEVDVICLRPANRSEEGRVPAGVRVLHLPVRHRNWGIRRYLFEYGLSFLLFLGAVTWRHLRRRYDYIQVNRLPDFLVFSTVIARKMGARVILDVHEPAPELWQTKYGARYPGLLQLQVRLQQRAIAYADRAITVTEAMRERLVSRGADPQKIGVVTNTSSLSALGSRPARRRPEGPPGRFQLVTHGYIEHRYGHDLVIQAVSELRPALPGLHYVIVGYGGYRSRLEELTARLDCQEAVTFLGYVDYPVMIETIVSSDLGLVPMRRSPYSELIDTNKMYEYMSLGVPVLSSRLPPVEDRFDSSCIEYFEPDDVQSLKEALERLYRDPGRLERLAANARERMTTLSWEREKSRYLAVYGR